MSDDFVTVSELIDYLRKCDPNAPLLMSGTEDVGLVGWSNGELEGREVVLLAFASGGAV